MAAEESQQREGVLGEEILVFPPAADFGYLETPANGVTFGHMGVDGVHFVALTQDGTATDELPIIHVSPTDADCYSVLAPNFAALLALACGASALEVDEVLAAQRSEGRGLVPFMKRHFRLRGTDRPELLAPDRQKDLAPLLNLIERKPLS